MDRGIVAAAHKLNFKFALLDERAQFHKSLDEYMPMLVRGLKRYKDHPAYLLIEGKPVVYLYQVAADPGLTADEFRQLEKHIPADWLATPGVDCFGFYSTFSHFRAHAYEDLVGRFRHMTSLAHGAGKKMLLPVHPGHDNSHFVDAPYVMPRRDGQTLRDFLRAASEAGADYLMVTSWNEWPESTVIEPSTSWEDPYQYLRILAGFQGKDFNPPALPDFGKEAGP